jgi:hypothetical protein
LFPARQAADPEARVVRAEDLVVRVDVEHLAEAAGNSVARAGPEVPAGDEWRGRR